VSATTLPAINALVDVSLIDGSCYPSRVEDVDGRTFTVAAPFGIPDSDRPNAGASLELVWVYDGNRFAVPARFTSLTREQPQRWLVQVVGSAQRKSRRRYMRGGWGEPVRVTRATGAAGPPVHGSVIDMSERGVRCRIRINGNDYAPDESVELAMTLGDEVVSTAARVLIVRYHQETGCHDLVATYEPTETVSRVIRGYILRRQMEERRRIAEDAGR
jgi:hypothetical protein